MSRRDLGLAFRFARGLALASRRVTLALALLLAYGLPLAAAEEAQKPKVDTCIDCHSNPKFVVTNKKLYEYFERWSLSIHKQEGVTCVDCHGGDPTAADKEKAHAGDLPESGAASPVNFRNIPSTCGECHEEVYEGFRKSAHYEHVAAKKQEDQGPTCVTCHGSINVAVLNVNTVEKACLNCHNEESDNHPETAEEARSLLNRFLSIHRYYRYITVRGDPLDTREFFSVVDTKLRRLSVTWHTFDLDEIRKETDAVLEMLRAKREQLGREFKERRRQRSESQPET